VGKWLAAGNKEAAGFGQESSGQSCTGVEVLLSFGTFTSTFHPIAERGMVWGGVGLPGGVGIKSSKFKFKFKSSKVTCNFMMTL
jgi:hypothetical protein